MHKLVTPFIAVALLGASIAASANSNASLTITSFGYTTTGGALSWSAPDDFQMLNVTAMDAGGLNAFDSNSNMPASGLAASTISATTPHGSATVTAALNRTFSAGSSATNAAGASFTQPDSGVAQGLQSGAFTLASAGSVTFTVGYTMTLTALGGSASTDYSQAYLSFTAGAYGNTSGGTATLGHYSYDATSGTATYSGTLTETVTLAGGANAYGYYDLTGNTYAYATAAAAVPEPESLALMLAGLGGIGFIARRRPQA